MGYLVLGFTAIFRITLVRVACLLGMVGSACPIWPEITRTGRPADGQARVPEKPFAASDSVELRRGPCYGPCPVYAVRISADGSVTWIGTASVRTAGNASGNIAADKAKALMEQFRTLAFWSLCGHYSQLITDHPTYKTTVHMGGMVKEVSDYAETALQGS
jgi:hypothetical protein